MAAQQQEEAEDDDRREQQFHDEARHQQILGERIPDRAVLLRFVIGVLASLLHRGADAFRRGAETAQQREDGEADDRQNGDLAQRIEPAKIDQDDIDDIGAAALRIGALHEEAGDAVGQRAGHHRIGKQGHRQTGGNRDEEVGGAAQRDARRPAAFPQIRPAHRQPAQAEKEQHGGDDLHQQLGCGEVGGGEPEEAQAGGDARAAQQHHGGKAVIFGVDRSADRADPADDPDQREDRIDLRERLRAGAVAEAEERQRAHQQRHRDQDAQLHLQPACTEPALQRFAAIHDFGQHALERAPSLQPTDDGRAFHRVEPLAEQQIAERASSKRGKAHHQGQGEAVPDGEAVAGHAVAQHRLRRRRQKRRDGERGRDAREQAGHHQYLDRQAHPGRRFMRLVRQVDRRRTEKALMDKAQRIEHAERARERGEIGQRLVEIGALMIGQRLGEEHLLGKKAVHQRHACHCGGRNHGERRGDRHIAVEAGQLAQVARAGLMVDDARRHE